MKFSYRWWAQGFHGGVYETVAKVDNTRVFATFTEARTALGDHFSEMERHAGAARYRARNMKKASIKDGEVTI